MIKCPWVEGLKNKLIEHYAAIKWNDDYFYILIWNTLQEILTSEKKSRWGKPFSTLSLITHGEYEHLWNYNQQTKINVHVGERMYR